MVYPCHRQNQKEFLVERKERGKCGCFLVAWEKVMRPLDLGGLGIHNLEIMGLALQMRWLWIEKLIRIALGLA